MFPVTFSRHMSSQSDRDSRGSQGCYCAICLLLMYSPWPGFMQGTNIKRENRQNVLECSQISSFATVPFPAQGRTWDQSGQRPGASGWYRDSGAFTCFQGPRRIVHIAEWGRASVSVFFCWSWVIKITGHFTHFNEILLHARLCSSCQEFCWA